MIYDLEKIKTNILDDTASLMEASKFVIIKTIIKIAMIIVLRGI